jgi:hypothetical protein
MQLVPLRRGGARPDQVGGLHAQSGDDLRRQARLLTQRVSAGRVALTPGGWQIGLQGKYWLSSFGVLTHNNNAVKSVKSANPARG